MWLECNLVNSFGLGVHSAWGNRSPYRSEPICPRNRSWISSQASLLLFEHYFRFIAFELYFMMNCGLIADEVFWTPKRSRVIDEHYLSCWWSSHTCTCCVSSTILFFTFCSVISDSFVVTIDCYYEEKGDGCSPLFPRLASSRTTHMKRAQTEWYWCYNDVELISNYNLLFCGDFVGLYDCCKKTFCCWGSIMRAPKNNIHNHATTQHTAET